MMLLLLKKRGTFIVLKEFTELNEISFIYGLHAGYQELVKKYHLTDSVIFNLKESFQFAYFSCD